MKVSQSVIRIEAPARRALVLVCEDCGKRIADARDDVSHRLVSRIKKGCKRRWKKGEIRTVLTSCMNLCPEDRIAVCVAPSAAPARVAYLAVGINDLEASANGVVDLLEPMRCELVAV